MRPCKDCNKAHEMVLASMEYVKALGFRIRKTEAISETWKKATQTHAEECVKLREQLHHLRTAAESGMLPQIVKERDALRAQLDTERERHKQTDSILAQYAPKTMQIEPPPEATHDTPEGKQAAESVIRDDRKTEPKPGDTVRLVRVPTQQDYPMVGAQWLLDYGKPGECGTVERLHINSMGVHVAAMNNGWQWPLSCVEVVKGGDK